MTPSPANIQEAKNLCELYETISLDEIHELLEALPLEEAKRDLTGFGFQSSCTLCQSVQRTLTTRQVEKEENTYDCRICIYGSGHACCQGQHEKTYGAILAANTSDNLLLAYRSRAAHIRAHLKDLGVV